MKQRPHLFERKSEIVLSIMTQPEITERITQVYSNYCQDGNVFVHASNFRTWQLVCSAASFSDCETRVQFGSVEWMRETCAYFAGVVEDR